MQGKGNSYNGRLATYMEIDHIINIKNNGSQASH